ncbi:MAG: tryptophan-rich sensory protein [Alphaproteobacteria bacterium]|nr:MAG: tryptophan-rich sensory protein [Alphaproteobacteria bacterium]
MPLVSVRQNWIVLLVFVALVLGIGMVVGLVAAPGTYVRELKMPDLVLPDAVSGILGLVLSVAFAIAGWRTWVIDSNSTEMRLWLATLILSWWFSPAFFIMRMPALALCIVAALFVLMVWFEFRTWRRDRPSFWLMSPSVVYIAYVAAMTAAIVAMN